MNGGAEREEAQKTERETERELGRRQRGFPTFIRIHKPEQ